MASFAGIIAFGRLSQETLRFFTNLLEIKNCSKFLAQMSTVVEIFS